jgi:hypothetical protein
MTKDRTAKPGPPRTLMRAHEELARIRAGRDAGGLRRGRPGRSCGLCLSRPSSSGPLLKAEFSTREPVRWTLAGYDFGCVFRAIRRTAGLTQEELGDLLDLDRISRIEHGRRRLRDIAIIARVTSRLGIPPVLLGFDSNTANAEWVGVVGGVVEGAT